MVERVSEKALGRFSSLDDQCGSTAVAAACKDEAHDDDRRGCNLMTG